MGLLGHWPFNESLEEYINGNDAVEYDQETYQSGKLGSAILFDNVNNKDVSVSPIIIESIWSVALWVYPHTDTKAFQFMIGPDSGATDEGRLLIERDGYVSYSINNVYYPFALGSATLRNKWSHLTFIGKEDRVELYVDGTLHSAILYDHPKINVELIGNAWSDKVWCYTGLINDVRVYDHILTPMEIQELARAKILHYTFNDNQEPSTNIIDGGADRANGITKVDENNHGAVFTVDDDVLYDISRQHTVHYISSGSGAYLGIGIQSSTNTVVGEYYMISFDYRNNALTPNTFTDSAIYGTGYKTPDGNSYGTVVDEYTTELSNGWSRRVQVYQAVYAGPNYYRFNINEPFDIHIDNLQFVKADHYTEFTDTNRTGLINNLTPYPYPIIMYEDLTPTWTTESKVGTGSYLFDVDKITHETAFKIAKDQLTLAAWVKPTALCTSDRGIVIQQNGCYYLTVNTAYQVSVYWYGTSPAGYHTTTEAIQLDEWSHIASTWDGTKVKLYINGAMMKEVNVTTPGNASGNPLTIGRESTNRAFNGYIDDVRQYATALSEKDIKDLYETRAEIEESGGLYAKAFTSNVTPTVNLLNDIDMASWNLDGSGQATVGTVTSYGENGVYVVDVNSNARLRSLETKPIELGVNYTVSVKYRRGEGHIPTFRWQIQGKNSINGTVSTIWTNGIGNYAKDEDGWQLVSYTFSFTDPTIEHVYLWFQDGADYTQYTHSYYLKDPQFELADVASSFTEDYRIDTPRVDTLEYGENEIMETGLANFDRYNTVGIVDDLIAYYPFDNDISDYSGNDQDGQPAGNIGIYGDHVAFSGDIVDYIILPNNLIQNLGDFTFVYDVVHTDVNKSLNTIFHASNAGDNTLSIETRQTYLRLFINGGATSAITFSPINGTRYHYVVKREGGWLFLHVDGEFISKIACSDSPVTINPSNAAIVLGQEQDGVLTSFDANQSFEGNLYYLKIFNRGLTAEEIKIEYNTKFNREVQVHEDGTLYAQELKQY